jgi:hypothetical protein
VAEATAEAPGGGQSPAVSTGCEAGQATQPLPGPPAQPSATRWRRRLPFPRRALPRTPRSRRRDRCHHAESELAGTPTARKTWTSRLRPPTAGRAATENPRLLAHSLGP